MAIFDNNAKFRPWVFTVSHRSLLIRASNADLGRNIDVMFTGVTYCELSENCNGLRIEKGLEADVEYLRQKCGLETGDEGKVYVLLTNGRRYYIVASQFRTEVNDLPHGKNNLMN